MSLSLVGYVSNIDGRSFTLSGIDPKKWKQLSTSYWSAGIHRRVSKNKKTCVVNTTVKTSCHKHGAVCHMADLDGCYVKVIASAKKYSFKSEGVPIEGWRVVATSLKTVQIQY